MMNSSGVMFSNDGPSLFELIHQALCSTQRGYDLLAPKFDSTPFRTPDEMIAPAVAAIGPVDAALDVCCGTGAGLRLLLPLCRQRAVGLDFSPGMLRQAKLNLENLQGANKLELIEGDVLEMSFRNAFDVITCFGALGHVPPGREIEFMRRVYDALKPGGRFVFYSAYPPSLLSASGLVRRTFNAVMRIRNTVWKPSFIMYYLRFLLPKVARQLESIGFTVNVQANVVGQFCLVLATKRTDSAGNAQSDALRSAR